MRTQTVIPVPFATTGRIVLTPKFKLFGWKQLIQYFAKQDVLPPFSGRYRQRGSGFLALAVGICRVAISFERWVNLPAAKIAQTTFDECSAWTEWRSLVKNKHRKTKNKKQVFHIKTARKQLGGSRKSMFLLFHTHVFSRQGMKNEILERMYEKKINFIVSRFFPGSFTISVLFKNFRAFSKFFCHFSLRKITNEIFNS